MSCRVGLDIERQGVLKNICIMDGIQLEITNACPLKCSNCTRFCAQIKKPYFMPLKDVKRAIDSTVGYPSFTGIMGGEPLLHPDFEEICKYAQTKRDPMHLGLWTTLPKGFEHHAQIICDTFYHVYVNDHTRPDIYHWPALVGIQEVIADKKKMWHCIDTCWVQHSWCASINPRGAWFCEMAASMSMLYEEGQGWEITDDWWMRTPKDYIEQMEQWCPRCGMAAPIALRPSIDEIDDISPLNYEALKDRVRRPERFKLHDLSTVKEWPTMAAYKDLGYRKRCAAKYGMYLVVNETGSWTAYMNKDGHRPTQSIYSKLQERYSPCATS